MKLPKARTKNIIVQTLGKEFLIYDLTTHRAFCLNETCAQVYQSCDGVASFEKLKGLYKFTDELILLALQELQNENLLEDKKTNYLGNLTRRDAIRRVGLTSMLALPLISSLIAPVAAQAQSACGALNSSCADSTQCCGSAPNCNNGTCCVGAGSEAPNAQYIAPTGQCATVAVDLCCSDSGTFSAPGPNPAVNDFCMCN